MEETLNNSNTISERVKENLRKISELRETKSKHVKFITYSELANKRGIIMIKRGKDPLGYDDVEYRAERIERPTRYNLQGEERLKERWWRNTRSDDPMFDYEWMDKSTMKEMNRLIRDEGFRISN